MENISPKFKKSLEITPTTKLEIHIPQVSEKPKERKEKDYSAQVKELIDMGFQR
jgi:hypothetical protein